MKGQLQTPASATDRRVPSAKTSLLQRRCACGGAPGIDGQCIACRDHILSVTPNSYERSLATSSSLGHFRPQAPAHSTPTAVQAKLTVSRPGDKCEQEADRTADRVMQTLQDGPTDTDSALSPPPIIQRICSGCAEEVTRQPDDQEEETALELLQRESLSPRGRATEGEGKVPPIVHEVLRSPGEPLDAATRSFFEPRFGHDFSQVRVHTDAKAAESARAVNALMQQHVAIGAGLHAPTTHTGRRLLAHELTHTIQHQPGDVSQLALTDSPEHEREADAAADGILYQRPIPVLSPLNSRSVSRQKLNPDEPPKIERDFEVEPHVIPMSAPAVREVEKCEEFPGGSTDCEVDQTTGTPTGKVTHRIDEINPCTRPCVEQHEAVHVKQLKTFCPQLRDCYLAADKGKRPISDCVKMAIFATRERECAAYKVSVPCVEKRLKTAKECQSTENKDYGSRKLTSEKCFRDKNCGGSASK